MRGALCVVLLLGLSGCLGSEAQSLSSIADYTPPVRFSRGFFDHSLDGRVAVISPTTVAPVFEVLSEVEYSEYGPVDPPPEGPFLADFRDQEGCVDFPEQSPVRLCFVVMPDVSTIEASAGKMRAEGLETWLTTHSEALSPAGCDSSFKDLRFDHASKTDQDVQVYYRVEQTRSGDLPECVNRSLLIRVQLLKVR